MALERLSAVDIPRRYLDETLVTILAFLSILPTLENILGTEFNEVIAHMIVLTLTLFQLYSTMRRRSPSRAKYLLHYYRLLTCCCLFYLVRYSLPISPSDSVSMAPSSPRSVRAKFSQLISRYQSNLSISSPSNEFYWFEYELGYPQLAIAVVLLLIVTLDWACLLGCALGYFLVDIRAQLLLASL